MNSLGSETRQKLVSSVTIQTLVHACKELVENSIDANSKAIKIVVNNFDVMLKDDGVGIPMDALNMIGIFEATSKRVENRGHMFGFKGLSLKSLRLISSSFCITTRTAGDTIGACMQNGAIQLKSAAVGTTVDIKELFYNLPVRMNYIQQNYSKQMSGIKKLVEEIHFVHHRIRFELVLNGNCTLFLPYENQMVT